MGRKKSSLVDDLFAIGAALPWKVGLLLALLSFLGFHYIAVKFGQPLAVTTIEGLGRSASHQLFATFGTIFQYLFPICLLIGSLASYLRQIKHRALHEGIASRPTRDALEALSWEEFEGLVAEAFRQKGYQVRLRGGAGPDGGVDVELHLQRDKYLVQCKHWRTRQVGVAVVRELYGVMAAEAAVGGFVVTSGSFTPDAADFAQGRGIKLLPAEKLLSLVSTEKSLPHSQQVVPSEQSVPNCPLCNSAMVRRTAKKGDRAGARFWGCTRFPECRGTRD